MKIGIVGWGVEGQSAYNFFGPDNDYLIVNEHPRDDFPPASDRVKVQHLTDARPAGLTGNATDLSYMDGLAACDKIICTPTAYKNLQARYPKNDPIWPKITSNTAVFFETAKTKNIIGVTGTKGKGTTTTLIQKMLQAAGKTAYLGGNVGNSPLDFAGRLKPDDWVVLELSSFQLYTLTYSPHIGVCLMIMPEHMDWHSDMDEYVEAKANLFRHQKANDIAIYFADNPESTQIAGYSPGQKIPYFKPPGALVRSDGKIVIGNTEIIDKSEVKLLGGHNLQNICAAVTAFWQVTQDIAAIKQVLTSFSGLEHRLEFVRELDGVKYYDDSFGTTPDTAMVAIQAFTQPKVLVLGGSDKGLPFDAMADAILKNNVRHVITIGDTGPTIAQLLKARGLSSITEGLTAMPDMVAAARAAAQPGDVVLLSTGSASFGLFTDYKQRGHQFKQAVLALA